jgi:hypothetical protein
MPDGEAMENEHLTDAFRKQLEAYEPTAPNPHLPPPYLYEPNPNIFIGGDPLAWLDVYSSDSGLWLAMVLPHFRYQARLTYDHCADAGGKVRALRAVLAYPNGTNVKVVSLANWMALRGGRFDSCWVPHDMDPDDMAHVSLSVRHPSIPAPYQGRITP